MLDIVIKEDSTEIKVVDGQGTACVAESKPFEEVLRRRLREQGIDPDSVIVDTELPEMKQAQGSAQAQKGEAHLG